MNTKLWTQKLHKAYNSSGYGFEQFYSVTGFEIIFQKSVRHFCCVVVGSHWWSTGFLAQRLFANSFLQKAIVRPKGNFTPRKYSFKNLIYWFQYTLRQALVMVAAQTWNCITPAITFTSSYHLRLYHYTLRIIPMDHCQILYCWHNFWLASPLQL